MQIFSKKIVYICQMTSDTLAFIAALAFLAVLIKNQKLLSNLTSKQRLWRQALMIALLIVVFIWFWPN